MTVMKRFLLVLVIASIVVILGVAAFLILHQPEPCVDFPNSQDRYIIVIAKTTGQRIRVKNCARP